MHELLVLAMIHDKRLNPAWRERPPVRRLKRNEPLPVPARRVRPGRR